VDDIYTEMDLDKQGGISSQEMLQWTTRGNNIVDRLADIIEKEVYTIWLAENEKRLYKERRLARDKQAGMNPSLLSQAVDMPPNFDEQQPLGRPDQHHYAHMPPPTWSECPTDRGPYGDSVGTRAYQLATTQLDEESNSSPAWDERHVGSAVKTSDEAWSGPALDVTSNRARGGPSLDSSHYSGSPGPQYGGPPGRGRMPENGFNGRQHETSPGKATQPPGAYHDYSDLGGFSAYDQAQVHPSSPSAPTHDPFSSGNSKYNVPPPPPPPKRVNGPSSPSSTSGAGYGAQPPQHPSSYRVGNRIPPPPVLQVPASSPPYQPLLSSGRTDWNGMG